MTPRLLLAALCLFALLVCRGELHASPQSVATLAADVDRLFDSPVLSRALVGARVESLSDGRVIYERNADRLVMPASNMKILTVAAAVERLGWDYRFETRLEAAGTVSNGMLTGDLIVTGTGDPSIGSPDGGHALVFLQWADALRRAGITRVSGRLIGDDNAFDDERLGAGWAWDYLSAGYAAPVSALNYNENTAVLRITPGTAAIAKPAVEIGPPGHLLTLVNDTTTGAAGSTVSLDIIRFPGDERLVLRGSVAAGGPAAVRTAAVDNPTRFFVEGLRLALASRGVTVAGGAWDVDDLAEPSGAARRMPIAAVQSEPLSALAGYAVKVSQNFYCEAFLKALGRQASGTGTADAGKRAVKDVLASWKVPADAIVQYDGSGLSRYNYVTASAVVTVLRHVWNDERMRGRFVADLPVAGHDGTLETRMKNTVLARNVQAKTGTISNARALSGFLQTAAGEKLVFSIIVNHYTAPTAEIDAVVEKALERIYR